MLTQQPAKCHACGSRNIAYDRSCNLYICLKCTWDHSCEYTLPDKELKETKSVKKTISHEKYVELQISLWYKDAANTPLTEPKLCKEVVDQFLELNNTEVV